jgi:hypothetical protein
LVAERDAINPSKVPPCDLYEFSIPSQSRAQDLND